MTADREQETARLNDELTRVFNDGSVFSASDEDLNKYLKHLCSGYVPNEMVRHREMNRCQVINTVKTFRFIDSVERSNKIFTVIIIILTLATVYLTYQSIVQSKNSSKQIERLISSQEKKEKLIVSKIIEQVKIQNNLIEKISHQNLSLVNELSDLSKSNEDIAKEVNNLSYSNKLISLELKNKNASNKAFERDGAKKRAAPQL